MIIPLIESLKLHYRAFKYKNKDDRGGIAYILSSLSPGQTAMDIGAHKAGYLHYMQQQVGITGLVYAFEPQSNLYQYLCKMVKIKQWKQVVVERIALSDQQGSGTLYIPTNQVSDSTSSPGASLLQNKDPEQYTTSETVPTDTLDQYCSKRDIQPHFLKIDVEGNELKVLKGAIYTLQTYKPKILIEIEARHIGAAQVFETFTFLMSIGYTGHFIEGSQRSPLAEFRIEQHQNIRSKNAYCNNFTFE